VVEFGTVGKTMHQIDESVATSDLVQLERITARVFAGYFRINQG
jgi:succinyl-diaminopimelate desuccinylase